MEVDAVVSEENTPENATRPKTQEIDLSERAAAFSGVLRFEVCFGAL